MDSPFADLSLSSLSGVSEASSEVPPANFSKMHGVLTRLGNSHTSLNPDTWGFKVRRYVNVENDCRISRLAKFTLENGNIVYILAENCEVITSECIRQIAQDATFSMTKQGGEKIALLSDLFIPEVRPAVPVTFAVSHTLEHHKVVIQYTRSNTVLIHYRDLKTVLSPCYTVLFCSPRLKKRSRISRQRTQSNIFLKRFMLSWPSILRGPTMKSP